MTRVVSLNRSVGLLLWGALVAAIVLTSFGERRVDFWWQLREGAAIWSTHRLPTDTPTAFGLPARPYIDEYGLYEVVLAMLYKLGGPMATHLAFITIYLSIFLIPLLAAKTARRDLLSAALLALAGIFLINRYEQRPELVGVLLFTVLLALLHRTREFSPGLVFRLALLFRRLDECP